MHKTLAQIAQIVDFNIEALNKRLDKFQDDFAKDPAHALEWSTSTFEAVAELKVQQKIKAYVDHFIKIRDENPEGFHEGASVEIICKEATEMALSMSTRVPSSTSPTSNLLDSYTQAAWVRTIHGFGRLF